MIGAMSSLASPEVAAGGDVWDSMFLGHGVVRVQTWRALLCMLSYGAEIVFCNGKHYCQPISLCVCAHPMRV